MEDKMVTDLDYFSDDNLFPSITPPVPLNNNDNFTSTFSYDPNFELFSPDIPMDSLNHNGLYATSYQNPLIPMIESLTATMKEIQQLTAKNEQSIAKNEQSIALIITMLQQQMQSNGSINTTVPLRTQFAPTTNASELWPSTNEILTGCSDQDAFRNIQSLAITTNNRMAEDRLVVEDIRNENFVENKQPTDTISSNSTIAKNDRSHNEYTTTNELNFNNRMSIVSNKIRCKKNKKQDPIGRNCNEFNGKTTEQIQVLIEENDEALSTIQTSPSVIQSDQPRHKQKSSPNTVNHQPSYQLTTTNENLSICYNGKDKPAEFCLLHPLTDQLSTKTDRSNKVTDCFGEPPVLLLRVEGVFSDIELKMDMISTSSEGCYHSLYQLKDQNGNDVETKSFQTDMNGHNLHRIILKDLSVRKKCHYDMQKKDEANKQKRNKTTYKLKKYPSGEEKDVTINGPKDLKDMYKLNDSMLAICISHNNIPIENQPFFCSNQLCAVSNVKSVNHCLKISNMIPCAGTIDFDHNNHCHMEFSAEVSQMFHCTLASGFKWLDVSLITGDELSTMYYIASENGEKRNPYYINVKNESFKVTFEILKVTLPELMNNSGVDGLLYDNQYDGQRSSSNISEISNTILPQSGLNRFHVKIRILHSEGFPYQSPIIPYDNCETWKSKEFIENTEHLDKEKISMIRQKRKCGTSDDSDLDYDPGRLPVIKASKNN